MNHKNFVTVEEVSAKQNNIKTLIRFAGSLSLLHKLMAPTLLVMFFAAAIPPYFLWFVGEMLGCFGEAGCSVTHEFMNSEVVVPATISTLVMLVLLAMFCRISAWMLFELSGQWSTQNVHRDLMQNMSNVRTTFYDENPSGRLLNRMLSDWGMFCMRSR